MRLRLGWRCPTLASDKGAAREHRVELLALAESVVEEMAVKMNEQEERGIASQLGTWMKLFSAEGQSLRLRFHRTSPLLIAMGKETKTFILPSGGKKVLLMQMCAGLYSYDISSWLSLLLVASQPQTVTRKHEGTQAVYYLIKEKCR